VVVTGLLVAAVVLLAVIAAMTFLTWQGRDPDPVLRLAMEALGTVALVANLLLTLAQRAGVAKVERKAGRLEVEVSRTLDELDARTTALPDNTEYHPPVLPPVPDTVRHPFRGQSAAPVSGGS
jgi:anti-sigma-K factor RskA